MTDMPRFDFSGSSIKSDEELQKAEAEAGSWDKFLKPGQYEVEIDSVEFKGAARNDANWGSLEIVYKAAGDKTVKGFLDIPFKEVKYGEKGSLYPFKRVKEFCGALGYTLTMDKLGDTMKTVFGNPAKLKGKAVKIEVGYQKGHVEYAGKNEAGNSQYHIVDKDGNKVLDADKNPLVFADHAAANEYAEANKIPIDKFVRVLAVAPSANAKPAEAAKNDNW